MKKRAAYIILNIFFLLVISIYARSPFRPKPTNIPTLYISYKNDPTSEYCLQHEYLQISPFFKIFDRVHFFNNLLPDTAISFRNKPGSVLGSTLKKEAEQFLSDILHNRTSKNMIIIKKKDIDRSLNAGFVVARFKKYPFVIKLSWGNPKGLANAHTQGFEPWCFFMLGGGASRHLTGFTRIKNKNYALSIISKNPYYKDIIEAPRKWFWLPHTYNWISIIGKNLGGQETLYTEFPAIYGVICDQIEIKETFSITNKTHRRIALSLSNYLEQAIDPHINNFVIEKDTNKIVLLDTEHFPTMIGYNKPPACKSYVQWYTHLASHALKIIYGSTKAERLARQKQPHFIPLSLITE